MLERNIRRRRHCCRAGKASGATVNSAVVVLSDVESECAE